MILRRCLALILALLGLAPALVGCQTEPVTGRRQLILLTREEEMRIGQQAYAEVLKNSRLSNDYTTIAILQRVGQRIAAQAHEPDFCWEFKLIESPQVNAFCLPGGKVAVYTGILTMCKNEAGLAAVIGHEVAHAIARHGAERMSQGLLMELGAKGIEAGMRSSSPRVVSGVLAAYGIGAQVGVLLPYSRVHESAADEIGIRLMAKAGYDPSEAVRLWERMAAAEKQKPPEFLSTHPSSERRIKELMELLPAMQAIYEKAPQKYGLGVSLGK